MELKIFLKKVKSQIKTNNISQIVVGNESVDLDSVISTIILAFYYHKKGEKNIIPLINCKKNDYRLKTETQGLLEKYNINKDELIFIDDINNSIIKKPNNLKIIVVDHNKLSENLKQWDNSVVAIFDHHKDIKMYKNAKPRVFKTVGSCSTLIADFILKNNAEIYKTEEIAILNISPILLDTINLNKKYDKVTSLDIEISEHLKKYISKDISNLYNDLQYMKSDISNLSTVDLLKKDYKQWVNKYLKYGIASVPISIKEWLVRDENFIDICKLYMKNKKIDLLLIMTSYTKKSFKRELIIITFNKKLLKNTKLILNNAGLELSEYNGKFMQEQTILAFKQHNLSFSRKKIQPLLELHMSNLNIF